MGSKTLNDIFYKPDIGASGAVEKGKFDDGLDVADGFIESNKPVNNKLSAFAVTTSEELAGKISDEMGAGKLRFDTSVTAKTAIATLNVNEAGIILVSCAVTPYTITLPTPIGNTGLKYKIKKTDYNYNLITFATVAGKFNYVNDDGTLKDTYTRVNTPGAEVVFVADGANWQVIDEALGQVPECSVYLSANQENLVSGTWTLVEYDTESYDIGSNFNTTTHKFITPIPGRYQIAITLSWVDISLVADKAYAVAYKVGEAFKQVVYQQASVTGSGYGLMNILLDFVTLALNDEVTVVAKSVSGVNTVDIGGATYYVTVIKLISKE